MNNALALPNIPDTMAMADQLVRSGFLPQSIKNAQQAFAIITLGQELGIGPWAALNGITVIQGKPTVSPQTMLALINRSGFLEDRTIEGDANGCTVMFKRKGQSPYTYTFTAKDADALGLTGKDNYKKQKAIMLKWRAVAGAARVVFPDVIQGLYTPEEIAPDLAVDEDGVLVNMPTEITRIQGMNGQQTPALGAGDDAPSELFNFVCEPIVYVNQSKTGRVYYSFRMADDDDYIFTWERQPFRAVGWNVEGWTHDGQAGSIDYELDRQPVITARQVKGRWEVVSVLDYKDSAPVEEAA